MLIKLRQVILFLITCDYLVFISSLIIYVLKKKRFIDKFIMI